jgi:nitrogenase molybdenum-iron protein alpha/beta subunit
VVTYTYLVGVYLAVNAIRDAWLLVEGPDCVHLKTQFVAGNHDWMSTLTSVSGFHRVANTALHPVGMTASREKALRDALMRIAAHPAPAGVMLTSMPMAFITGADYGRLCGEVAVATGKTPILVPGKSLSGDWMDGYAEALLALARTLDLSGGSPSPAKVAIVGHLFDRNEEDQTANARVLRGLIEGLGLEPVSIWLEGQAFAELPAVRDAGTVLSFPYARKAAREVARRTGARLVECELPFGLAATERFVRQVGKETGREREAEALIDRELASIVPRLEFVIPYVFQNRRFGWVGDPILGRGFAETARMLGASVAFAVVTNPARQLGTLRDDLGPDARVLVSPRRKAMVAFLRDAVRDLNVSLVVTNHSGMGVTPVATVEFGFPSMYQHNLYERPFLGFAGAIAFADTLANAIRHQEVVEARATGAWTRHRT